MEHKSRWVKDGHKTPQHEWSTFSGVGSRESIGIAVTYDALNDPPVFGTEVQNDLRSPLTKTNYIICCPKFGLEN